MLGQLRQFFWESPINAIAVSAAAVALAFTPIGLAILGRQKWFEVRRGRTLQRPGFWSVACSMALVMGVPAIFLAMMVKSQYFDKNRYEFDPNRTLSVLDQGRQFESLRVLESAYKADEGVRKETERLKEREKLLVESVKKLDQTMLALREQARLAPSVAPAMNEALMKLADVRKSVGLDAPQQLIDLTALPAAITRPGAAPVVAAPTIAPTPAPAASAGLSATIVESEIASVPEPQRALAKMLPLADLPAGWVVNNQGTRHLETFNAENLYEKIDGRAESFLQFGVKGMAYASYHPKEDENAEAQLYIFEMGDTLRALGKYASEKPEETQPIKLGAEGYTTAGSVFFRSGAYYTMVTLTTDNPKVAAFALELAKRVAAQQIPAETAAGGKPATSPDDLFKLLPAEPKKSAPKYVAKDVFGYSFLSDVFLADYQEGEHIFQGFLRPYATPAEAKAAFTEYVESVKKDGATVQEIPNSGAERMVVLENKDLGLTDAIVLKGNALAGANGSPVPKIAEEFARKLAKELPANVPIIETPSDAAAEKAAQ